MHFSRAWWASIVVAVLCGSCSSGPTCSASNCNGCCDQSGSCQLGTTTEACGASGGQCTACGTGLQCLAGRCSASSGGGSGTGGSGTGGGGSSAGGGSSSGGGAATGGGVGGGGATGGGGGSVGGGSGGGGGGGSASGGGTGGGASGPVTLIVEPNGSHAAELINAIKAATTSVYMTMYEIDNASILNALVARKQAGLDVKVILDGSTTTKTFNTAAFNQLQGAGVGITWSNPSFTYTHEKCVILDGTTAWIMTMNANTSSPNYNREFLAIDTDPGDVAEATAIFNADYAMTSITPSGNLVVANDNARQKLYALIGTANSTVDLEVEEFSDTHSLGIVDALVAAANRGVAVRVIIANETLSATQTTAITSVKQAGAHVVMTGPTSGSGTTSNPYIHAKAIAIDCQGTTCVSGWVGSENMSGGSLSYNRELGVILNDPTQIAKIETAFNTDYANGVAQ